MRVVVLALLSMGLVVGSASAATAGPVMCVYVEIRDSPQQPPSVCVPWPL